LDCACADDALVSMYKAIPHHCKTNVEMMSNAEKGLFRKDKEIKAVMDAVVKVMGQRGGQIIGNFDPTEDMENAAEKLALIKAGFKNDDLHYDPPWDKRWATNKALGIMTTSHTNLKIISVSIKKKDEPDFVATFTKRSEFLAIFPGEDSDLSTELANVSYEFTFRRLLEIEDQPIERLRRGDANSWHIHETPMLSFLEAFGLHGEETMTTLCGGRADDPYVIQFTTCRKEVEGNAKKAVRAKLDALTHEGELTVDPREGKSMNPGIVRFHQEKGKGDTTHGIKQIGQLKRDNQAALNEFERINDNLKEYLERVKKRFWWSRNCIEKSKARK